MGGGGDGELEPVSAQPEALALSVRAGESGERARGVIPLSILTRAYRPFCTRHAIIPVFFFIFAIFT